MRMRQIVGVAAVAVLALVGGACGGDDEDEKSDETTTTAESTETTLAEISVWAVMRPWFLLDKALMLSPTESTVPRLSFRPMA